MKKKPELFKRTGNSSLTIRNFLNNLKENDLHYENKQITQCVFLGVLRLKPVPTIFSNNNVPSVSAQKVNHRSKRIRNNNSNKELNKNVSKKIDINKVLGGKVTKKNPQKVKATVKKVPTKKSNLIKIKLNKDKKKANSDKKMIPSPANDKQEAISISSESSKALKALTPDAIIARPTITLNTIISPTKFNPVQSLFDKLKQKIDEGYNEPGPSTTARHQNKTKEGLQAIEAVPKVCKINAKRQGIPTCTNKKPKKAVNKKHEIHDCLTNPTAQSVSPITISDTESTGKKDKDDVIIIEDNNLLNIQNVTEIEHTGIGSEDIIFVNDDSDLAKSKEIASPSNKIVFRTTGKQKSVDNAKKHRVIVINEQQKLLKSKDCSQTLLTLTDTNSDQFSEVIVIPDEPKSELSNTRKSINGNPLTNEDSRGQCRNDVIIIEEVREIGTSPRSRKMDELQKQTREGHTSNGNSRGSNTNEVICIADETRKVQTIKMFTAGNGPKNNSTRDVLMNKSNSQQLNIAIEEQQNMKSINKVAASLLKVIDKADNTSITSKNELIQSKSDVQKMNVAEKPRQRKSKLKATLIPPMLLNAPMLLRSELAPKKTNTALRERDKPRVVKTRQKSVTKLEGKSTKNSTTKLITNNIGRENLKNAKLYEAPVRSQSLPLIQYKRPKDLSPNYSSLKNNTSGNEEVIVITDRDNMISPKGKCSANLSRTEIVDQNRSEVSSEKLKQNSNQEDVLSEATRQTASRLLRSDLHQKKTPESSIQGTNIEEEIIVINGDSGLKRKLPPLRLKVPQNSEEILARTREEDGRINTQEDQDIVVIMDEIESSEKTSPRLLRSDFTKKLVTSTSSAETELGNETSTKIAENHSPKNSNNHIFDRNITENHDAGAVAKISKSLEIQNTVCQVVENFPVDVDDQIIIVKDDSKPNENESPKTMQSTSTYKNKAAEVLAIDESEIISQKIRTSPRLLRSEMALQKSTSDSPQNAKQIDLDEIVVVNERRTKKNKNKSSEKLLRSDLARENLQVKAELEEVVVLIHDEPKQKNRTSPKPIPAESEQTNKKKICINEIIVLSEQTKREKSPRSIKSDAGQKDGSAKTSPKTLNVDGETRTSPSRLLRSHHSPKQISVEVTNESENHISPRLRSEVTSQRSLQNFQVYKAKEGKPVSPRSLRSDIAPNLPTTPDTTPTAVQKFTTSPRMLRSDMSSETSSRVLPADQSKSNSTSIKLKIRKPVSSRLRRSEPILQKNTSEEQLQCNSPEESSKKKRRSPANKDMSVPAQSKTKLKTPMLLRSELAQLKNGETDGPVHVEKDILKKKNIRSTLKLLPDGPNPSNGKKSEVKPKRKSLIDDLKKKKSTNLQQIPNSNSSPELPIEVHNPPHINRETKIGNSTVDVEEVKMEESSVKCENNIEEGTPNKSKAIRNKTTSEKPCTDTPTSSPNSNDLEIISETSPKQNRKRLSAKRKLKTKEVIEKEFKTPEKPMVTETIRQQEIIINPPKKVDTTVFDFDESEPEVVPLRLNVSPKRTRHTKIAVEEPQEVKHIPSSGDVTTPKAKKQKVTPNKTTKDDPKTKAQAKAKLIAMFNEKSPQKDMELPETPLKEKNTKIKTPSKIKNAPLDKSLTSSNQIEKTKTKRKSKKSLDNPNVSPSKSSPKKQTSVDAPKKPTSVNAPKKQTSVNAPKKQTSVNAPKKQTSVNAPKKQISVNDNSKANTSPMKQTTITDMFSKAPVKKETTAVVDSIFETSNESVSEEESAKENTSDNTITEMPGPKRERKVIPPFKTEEVNEDEMYDDDSDCESRIEWMPEEYAEYKFKYSAKKMMSYKPIHKCKICLLILPSYYRLSKHKKEHAKKPNPYNCTQCDQAFPSIEDLTAHLRIHKGKHPYTCKKCDVGFWSKKSLDAHTPIHVLKKVKQPNKRFRCDVCAKEFSKLCDMERHTRVHTGEKPCVCNICNKRFQQSHNLSKHLLTHLHVKPYHCEICNKQFGRNDVLNRHLLTHSVDKPIKCPLCPKAFIRQTQLNNHMTKNHPNAAKITTNEESKAVEAK